MRSDFGTGLRESLEISDRIAAEGGRTLASFNPYFQVLFPSRIFDSAAPDGVSRPIDLCFPDAVTGARANGGPCDELSEAGVLDPIPFDDPRSTFRGARRFVDVNSIRISNADGPTIWYTDPFGTNGRPEPFVGSVRQFIARADYDRATIPSGPAIGRDRDYGEGPACSRAELRRRPTRAQSRPKAVALLRQRRVEDRLRHLKRGSGQPPRLFPRQGGRVGRPAVELRKVRGLASLVFCAAVAFPTVLADQQVRREGLWWAGIGYGFAYVACDICTAYRDRGLTATGRAGGTLSRSVLLGGELNGWTRSDEAVDEYLGSAASSRAGTRTPEGASTSRVASVTSAIESTTARTR